MVQTAVAPYTSKIIKAGALLSDTKALLAAWDETRAATENIALFQRTNILGKASRSRVEDVLAMFRQRYLFDESVARALATLTKRRFPVESLDRILYFYAAQSDRLLHDVVTEVLAERYLQGRSEIVTEEVQSTISQWVAEGRAAAKWSDYTVRRVTQGLLATLRDFGVLQGAVKKRLSPIYLPVSAFAFIALYLRQRQASGDRLLHDGEWRLFFLTPDGVENLFMAAHQKQLLEYYAAGPVIRISFPAESLEEYARVISQRSP